MNNFPWYFVWVNFLYTEPCYWWKWWLLWLFSKLSFRRWVTQHLLAKLGPFIQFMAKIELSTDTGIAKISLLKAYICFLSTKKTNKRHFFYFLANFDDFFCKKAFWFLSSYLGMNKTKIFLVNCYQVEATYCSNAIWNFLKCLGLKIYYF